MPVHIAFVSAEAAPYAKVGGLADVAGSLPGALAALGHEVTLFLPLHGSIDRTRFGIPAKGPTRAVKFGARVARVAYPSIQREGVRVVFVDNARLLARERVYGAPEDNKRYAFFCRPGFEELRQAHPDRLHAPDWHASLLGAPVLRWLRQTPT